MGNFRKKYKLKKETLELKSTVSTKKKYTGWTQQKFGESRKKGSINVKTSQKK